MKEDGRGRNVVSLSNTVGPTLIFLISINFICFRLDNYFMSLAVIDKALESYGRNYYKKGTLEKFQRMAGSQLEKIFKIIRDSIEPKQKLEMNLKDCGVNYRCSLTSEDVTITGENDFTEIVPWKSYLQHIKNSFPHEMLIASKELGKLKESNIELYQKIK